MDITIRKERRKSNQFINGEAVNYAIACIASFTLLIAVKQLLKTFLGIDTTVACVIGFIFAEVSLFLHEKFFVFRNNISASPFVQALFILPNAGVHFGIFLLAKTVLCDTFGLYDFTAWFTAAIFIFVINYPIARILIFNCPEKPDDKNAGKIYNLFLSNRFIVLSMIVSLICMGFAFIIFKVFPFGDTTVLRMDLYHQYGPLFIELFDRITQGKSFIYSWISGGGSPFIGNYFNYLSSPFNFLIFLFDRDQMPYAISFLVAFKCMLAAGAFTLYLKFSQKHHSFASAAFGVLYSFSAYMLAYFWNIMWLDGMFMLPLIVLGIERIIDSGKCKLYIISLIYMLFASYYIGFMLCIFSVIYFIAYFLLTANGSRIDNSFVSSKRFSIKALFNNKFLNRGFRFAFASIFAAAICAFFLIPVYYILSGSSATSDSFPDSGKTYFTILDFFQSHLAGLETTIRSSGDDVLPNVYCGVATLILVPLFAINKEIRLREKFVYIALLIFLFVSFNTNYLNFVWHAFHFPNDLPYRFSFMYSFILLVVAFKALTWLKSISIKEIGIIAMLWIVGVALSQELPTNKITDFSIYATIAFIMIWTAFLFFAKNKNSGKLIIGVLVVAITFCEVIICDTHAFNFNQKLTYYNENYDNYTEAVEHLKESDQTFYRTELCYLNTRMDPCIYGYNGISAFSSMAYEKYSRLQYSLGMYGNRINSYTYHTQTPVYNLMYSIKYVIYNGIDTRPCTDLYTKYYQASEDSSEIFKNDYFLPIAYGVNNAIDSWATEEGNPFQLQSDFFSLATGFDDVFLQPEYVSCEYAGITGDDATGNGTFWFTKYDSNYATIDITLRAVTDGNLYVYLSSSEIKTLTYKIGEETKTQHVDTPYIYDLGYFNAGDEVTINVDNGAIEGDKGGYKIYAYSINKPVFEEGYKKLLNNALDITEYSDTKISGTINIDRDCTLYSSIPYDEGWNVYIDGEKAETFMIGNCQLGVEISAGSHTVKYSYSPRGVLIGAAASAAAIIGFAALQILKKRKKLLQNVPDITPSSDN
ncbi:MAG: YfhO family protein [Eubacterium sp.]|nr:YfhO family protein [Eubacterium sp.]